MDKRERSCNFTETDKELLGSLVSNHFQVIENNKTVALTNHQKNDTSDTTVNEFGQMTKTNAKLASLLQPQTEPIKSRFDSTANYIIEDCATTGSSISTPVEPSTSAVPDEDDSHQTPLPSSQFNNTPIDTKSKKRTIDDVYNQIHTYMASKIVKTKLLNNKLQQELKILEIKKQKEQELLKQEKFNTLKAEYEYLIIKKKLDLNN